MLFLGKFENRCIKIAGVNSIRITKSINLLKFSMVVGVRCDTWIVGVASKQLRLLHGRVVDYTTVVNCLSPQMSELVQDAIAYRCGDIVGHFWLIRNGVEKLVQLKFEFFTFNTFDVSQILYILDL